MDGDTGVVLAAAGIGSRFGRETKKQFVELLGKPIIHYSLDVFACLEDVCRLVLVVSSDDLDLGNAVVRDWLEGADGPRASRLGAARISVVPGGARRQDSVLEGLRALLRAPDWPGAAHVVPTLAAVHDAARPLLRPPDAAEVIRRARSVGAAVLGTPVTDSLKRVRDGVVVEGLSRDEIWTVQTPQVARIDLLLDAYQAGANSKFTDESSALEAAGHRVAVVEGSAENMKITLPPDFEAAERILSARRLAAGG